MPSLDGLQGAGGLDPADAGCVYDFSAGREVVLVGFGGLVSSDLVGYGGGDTSSDGDALKAPFEFFTIASGLRIGKVFVRDLDQIFYQRGVRGVGRTADEVTAGLRALLAGSGRTVFVGQSAGGYAALLHGVRLGVDQVVAFSPLTFFTRRLRRQHGDDRWAAEMDEIRRLPLPRRQRRNLDLGRALEGTGHGSRIDVYYGAKSSLDVAHAHHVAFPNVTLHPVDTASHATARRLRESGALQAVLQEALHPS